MIALAVAVVVIPPVTPADTGTPITPFFTSNQNPVIQVHALPALGNARLLAAGQARYRLVNSLASNYTRRQRGNEAVFFDGETLRSTFIYSRGIGGDVEWQLHIPYVDNSGGSLDSFIIDWHDTFGLPQGGRDEAPNNQFEYRYQQDGVTRLSLGQSGSGLGDVRLAVAWQWQRAGDGFALADNVALRAQLSLPTGDSAQLRGSGAPELALWLSADKAMRWLELPASLWGGGGVLLMGDGDVLPEQQRRAALFGSIGAGARVLPWMNLKLQLDFHGPLYDSSGLTQINSPAVQLVMGGNLLLGKNVTLELAVTEDVIVSASPDVVFYLGLSVGD